MRDHTRRINFFPLHESEERLDSPIVAIESFIPLFLALHGLVLLLWLGNVQPWQWGVLAGLGSLSLLRVLGWDEMPALAYGRAAYIFLAGWLLMYSTGGAASFFALWDFVLVAVYPLVLRSRYTPFLPPTVVAGYLLLWPFTAPTSLSPALIFYRVFLLCFIGWLAYLFGTVLRRQAQRDWRITNQLAAERSQLQRLSDRNQAVLDSLVAHVALLDKTGAIIAVNQPWAHFATANGSPSPQATGMGANYLTVCEQAAGEFAAEAPAVAAGLRGVLAGQIAHFSLEYPCHSPTDRRWFLLHVAPLVGDGGGAVVSHTDITKRKQAEAALRQSEERYRTLAELSPDAILVSVDGSYVYANAAAVRLFGAQNEQELVGRSPLDFLAPEDHAIARERMRQVLEEKCTVPLKAYHEQRLDGSWVDVEVAASPSIWNGQPALQVVQHDISARKQAEAENARLYAEVVQQRTQLRALAARLTEVQEEERKGLARELHDQVGQNLSTLGLNLKIIQTQLAALWPAAEPIQPLLVDSQALVRQTTDQVRNVMAELRPPMLDDYGLPAALAWYANRMAKRANFMVAMVAEEGMPRLPAAVENSLFRIAQEAITNIVKHAQATMVGIRLLADAQRVVLYITDNGIGIEPTRLDGSAAQEGWGLHSMRERAELLGGSFTIDAQRGKGTHIQVLIAW